jgi:hypothetical protein
LASKKEAGEVVAMDAEIAKAKPVKEVALPMRSTVQVSRVSMRKAMSGGEATGLAVDVGVAGSGGIVVADRSLRLRCRSFRGR